MANVYDCPNPQRVRTAKDGGPDTVSGEVVYQAPEYSNMYQTPAPNATPCGQVVYGQLIECYEN